jgi:formylglycine-generating enzyme
VSSPLASSRARDVLVALGVLGLIAITAFFLLTRHHEDGAPCGSGFVRAAARCCVVVENGRCGRGSTCPPPLVATPRGCDEPERDIVDVPEVTVTIGPSDWEAEGRVPARTLHVAPFAIDRFEVSSGRACAFFGTGPSCMTDPARAASRIGIADARAYCSARGGRLPTDDEWVAAAAGERPRRYPWGDTGAVCRRAAWGLLRGPCAEGADGPDTVGAHPEGQTPLGIHDFAGNVAEWIEGPSPAVRGGSWDSGLASHLRTWAVRAVSPEGDATIGFRCAYGGVGWTIP